MGTHAILNPGTFSSPQGKMHLEYHCLALFFAFITISQFSDAQTIIASVPLEPYGLAMAVNPVTHKIYALVEPGNELTEIDGESFKKTVIPLGPTVEKSLNGAICVDPTTNKLYVINVVNSNVAVIDGDTHAIGFVSVGTHPVALEFNPKTKKLYVVNGDSDNVTVIDATTLKTETIAVGKSPLGIAINTRKNRIYVTNSNSHNLSIIDGKTNRVRTINVGPYPYAVAVNSRTNRAYVANIMANTVTVIHGRSNHTKSIVVGEHPFWIAVNARTNKIYLNHQVPGPITVVNGRTNAVGSIGSGLIALVAPDGFAVDEMRNKIYVAELAARVTIIDGATGTTSTVSNPGYNTHSILANPSTNEIYTLNMTTNLTNGDPPSSLTIFTGAK